MVGPFLVTLGFFPISLGRALRGRAIPSPSGKGMTEFFPISLGLFPIPLGRAQHDPSWSYCEGHSGIISNPTGILPNPSEKGTMWPFLIPLGRAHQDPSQSHWDPS